MGELAAEHFDKFLIMADRELNILKAGDDFSVYLGGESPATLKEIVYPQDLPRLEETVGTIGKGKQEMLCFRVRRKMDGYRWIVAHIESAADQDAPEAVLIVMNDISSLEREITETSFDQMTGLLNKQAIIDRAHDLTAKRPYEKFYLCVLDIDNFKHVNDTYGHMRGDEVIIDVAHALRKIVGEAGSVGRIGGDEYMILLEKTENEQEARKYLKPIRETVESMYAGSEDALKVTVTVGAVLFPDYAHTYDELFMIADKMLYIGKQKGRNRYIIYTPEVHGDVLMESKVSDTNYGRTSNNKRGLVLDLLDKALHGEKMKMQKVINEVICRYDLDELYVFQNGSEISRYGAIHKAGDMIFSRNAELCIPVLHTKVMRKLFNENGIAILDFRELKREVGREVYDYIVAEHIRYMIVCRMKRDAAGGYVVYLNRRDSSRKFADSDVTDLTYIGRVLELVSEQET